MDDVTHTNPPDGMNHSPSAGGSENGYQSHSLRILLVEDNPVNQMLMERLLKTRGHRVVSAANGATAISLYTAGKFDLVLLDMQLPDIDGLKVYAQIKSLEKETPIPVLALTAYATREYMEACLGAGMEGFLTKPIQPKQLLIEIEKQFMLSQECVEGENQGGADLAVGSHLFDLTGLQERAAGDVFLIHKVLSVFLETSADNVEALYQAIAKQDKPQIARLAHRLKGSALNIGANALGFYARELEDQAEQSAELNPAMKAELSNIYLRTVEGLKEFIRLQVSTG